MSCAPYAGRQPFGLYCKRGGALAVRARKRGAGYDAVPHGNAANPRAEREAARRLANARECALRLLASPSCSAFAVPRSPLRLPPGPISLHTPTPHRYVWHPTDTRSCCTRYARFRRTHTHTPPLPDLHVVDGPRLPDADLRIVCVVCCMLHAMHCMMIPFPWTRDRTFGIRSRGADPQSVEESGDLPVHSESPTQHSDADTRCTLHVMHRMVYVSYVARRMSDVARRVPRVVWCTLHVASCVLCFAGGQVGRRRAPKRTARSRACTRMESMPSPHAHGPLAHASHRNPHPTRSFVHAHSRPRLTRAGGAIVRDVAACRSHTGAGVRSGPRAAAGAA